MFLPPRHADIFDVCIVLTLSTEDLSMLVLSRQRDESIIIGDHIVITVVDIRGDKVRLGIEAPKEVPVHRQEVYEAIQRENALKTNAPKDELPAEKKS